MTGRLVPVEVDGVGLLVATVSEPGSQATAGRVEDATARVVQAFDHAQDVVVAVAMKVAGSVSALAARGVDPDQVQVEFGLSFTASGGVVVVSGSGEASLKVTVTFDRDRQQRAPTSAAASAADQVAVPGSGG